MRSADVAGLLGRLRQQTADVSEHLGVADLATGRRGHRLVHRAHAAVDVTLIDPGEPEESESSGLQVRVPGRARRRDRGLGVGPGAGGPRSQTPACDGEPSALDVGVEVADETLGPGEPAPARGLVADRLQILGGEPHGDARGTRHVATLAESRVGAFALGKTAVDIAEPPEGEPESVVGLGRISASRASANDERAASHPPAIKLPRHGLRGRRNRHEASSDDDT